MDIKLVLRKSTVFLFSILTVILAGIGIKFAYEAVIGLGIYTGDILMLITAVILYDPLKKRYFILANKYFFSSYYDSRKVISDISENLRKFLDTEKIYDYIYKKLGDAFHFTSFGVLSYDEEKKEYRAMYNRGFDIGNKQLFRGDKILRKKFINRNKPIIVEEVKNMYKGGHVKKLIDYLEKTGVEVIAPLHSQDKNIGLLVFGPKESGDMYNEEDLEVIKIVGAQAAVTIENARLYEKTKDFNIKLKKEVERVTKNLKAANRRLRQMDKTKTDFLSIASHQLRTPLTVIKGYISMLLDGTFGKMGKKQQGALEKVFESSDRLIDLVEDLLNISRIESGRMEYNKRLVQMREIVEGVHEELKTAAEKKGLRFFFNEPKKQLPKVNIDPEKIRQVVMNLTDNAIKYTEEGSVSLSLDKTKEGVKFCVEDTGRGIAKDEMGNLFQKFSRNEGSDLVHTEGTGLGLYVAKQIVEGHGGKIRAESKGKGKGSRFIFIIPTSNNSKKK
jgi:signal transduction histidine kinase